jgi:archaeosine synthase beta-subunit
VSPALGAREIRARRSESLRSPGDPWAAPPVVRETERLPASAGGGTAPALTLFLVGAECPFTCVFCDLWRHTLDGPTPPGALPAQVDAALAALESEPDFDLGRTVVKLYNASNFFEPRAVPPEDRDALADRLAGALRVVVECHPRLVLRRGDEHAAFAERLSGTLEVALGLETVHPESFPRLNKGMALPDFAAAAGRLVEHGIGVRAFVQVGVPWVPAEEAVEWAVRSAEHAFEAFAGQVSVIPTRGGPDGGGAMAVLAREGAFVPPTLADLEDALDGCLELPAARIDGDVGAVATADLWDLEGLATCSGCLPARRGRLARMNLSGAVEPRVACRACGG